MNRQHCRKILLTSGPTREYLDPVRFLSNASSGKMGRAVASAAIRAGFDVVIVSGPVEIRYPRQATVIPVVTTEEMKRRALEIFPDCDGAIGVAAPCDYRPTTVSDQKLSKDDFIRTPDADGRFLLTLEETPDILAALGAVKKPGQWLIPFALETGDPHDRAMRKLKRKNGDLIVVNNQTAIGGEKTSLEILAPDGESVARLFGEKSRAAAEILRVISERFYS